MPISVSTVRSAHLYPELLPDTQNINAIAGTEQAVLDLRRFGNKILRLNDLNVEQDANVQVRVFNDKEKYFINTGALRNRLTEPFDIIGTDYLRYALFGTAAPIVNHRTYYNTWVYEPTTADKIKLGLTLTQEDQEILKAMDLNPDINKGNIPLPIDYQIQREYQLIDGKRTFTFNDFVFLTEQVVQSFPVNMGEIAVLERISAAPNLLADNVRIRIDRDDDIDYIELIDYPMQINEPINCFIPALKEIKVKVIGDAVVAAQVQWTIARYKLTDILNIRFGLITKAEADPELWNKVKGGVF